MNDENPYAAPAEIPRSEYEVVLPHGEMWRAGRTLVFDRTAKLPARCIKCNTPRNVVMLPRTLHYYPPWIALFILCNLLVLIIMAFVFRKKAQVELGVCHRCRIRRRRAITVAWLLAVAGIGFIFGGPILEGMMATQGKQGDFTVLGVLGGVMLILCGAVVGIVRGQLVVVRLINDRQVRLTGVCNGFLSNLPRGP